MNNISTSDWLVTIFGGSGVFGLLAAVFGWFMELHPVYLGFVAFTGAVLVTVAVQINATIKRLAKRGIDNPNVLSIRHGPSTYIKEEREQGDKQSAFIKCRITGEIADAHNVSSITEMGTGLITINFASPFPSNDIVVSVVGAPPKDFSIVSVLRGSAVVRFSEEGNPMISLKFEQAR